MATLDLHYVNELIAVRQEQHGGGQGAPEIINGHRVGASINRSIVVLLSALLQSFVEELFQEISVELLEIDAAGEAPYRKSFGRWGNPSDSNIIALFLRLGVTDILADLSWQRITNERIRSNLKQLNELRNQIAHGRRELRWRNQKYSLSLAEAVRLRNFVQTFADRFPRHVRDIFELDVIDD
jgi:hypothetical protein